MITPVPHHCFYKPESTEKIKSNITKATTHQDHKDTITLNKHKKLSQVRLPITTCGLEKE